MIRIILADDHDIFLEAMKELVSKFPDLEIVGLAHDGIQAVEQTAEMMPDIVLMDMAMPHLNGIQATHQIHEKFPDVSVLILSMHNDREFLVESLKAGAHGYILKECTSEELYLAVQRVAGGQYYIARSVLPMLIRDYLRLLKNEEKAPGSNTLSAREMEILKLLAGGLNSKQIALQLSISKNTVDTHRRRILDKVGCNSLVDLTRYAIRNGYL
ncbi:MAG: response regulator transcription factor [Fretibacterium sp.]|nr:response regulator transcription factor [Fretibacterium sp.]